MISRDAAAKPGTSSEHLSILDRLESSRSTLLGPRMAEARDELRSEVDNLRAAVEWAAVHWNDDEARAAFDSLYTFFWMHSWFEGAESFERVSGLLDGSKSPKR